MSEDKIKWILCEWHAISSSRPTITMDGVMFQDILSITKKILDNKVVVDWDSTIGTLYNHIVDLNNPHSVTVEQFATTIVQLLYTVYISEGYTGSIQDFVIRIFTDISIGTYADLLMSETTESGYNLVTTVKMVADYIKDHDTSLDKAHDNLFSKIFQGRSYKHLPLFALYKYIEAPTSMLPYYDENEFCYKGYPLNIEGNIPISPEFTVATTLPISNAIYQRSFGFTGWELATGFNQAPFTTIEPIQALGDATEPILCTLRSSENENDSFILSYIIKTNEIHVQYTRNQEVVNTFKIDIKSVIDDLISNPTLTLVISVDRVKLSVIIENKVYTQNHTLMGNLLPDNESKLPAFDLLDIPLISQNSLVDSFALYPISFSGDQLYFIYGVYDKSISK